MDRIINEQTQAEIPAAGSAGNTFGSTLMNDTIALMNDTTAQMSDNDLESSEKPGQGGIVL